MFSSGIYINMESTRVRLSHLHQTDFIPLLPAPSINDDFHFPENPTSVNLTDGPLRIMSTYRGHAMYLENGAFLYRTEPKSAGGNGMVSIPKPGSESETCFVNYMGEKWACIVDFV